MPKLRMESVEKSETSAVVELRRRFRAALAVHLSDLTALTEVIGGSQLATKGLIEIEDKSRRAMVEARDALLAAIAASQSAPTS
jgi:hypothetical protein